MPGLKGAPRVFSAKLDMVLLSTCMHKFGDLDQVAKSLEKGNKPPQLRTQDIHLDTLCL